MMSAILFGCGSIGKRHLNNLETHFEKIVVIDSSNSVKKYIEEKNNPAIHLIPHIDNLQINEIAKSELVVIATYGPDHLVHMNFFAEKGAKKIIVEKPLTDSIEELEKLERIVINNDIIAYCHFPWDVSTFLDSLEKLQKNYHLGPLISSNLIAGAKCLATTGIHYLNLINKINKKSPLSVFASILDSRINPRGKQFSYLEGTIEWVYDDNFRFLLNMNNRISLNPNWQFFWEEALLTGDPLSDSREFKLYAREKRRSNSPIVHTLPASEFLGNYEMLESQNLLIQRFYEQVLNNSLKSNLKESINANRDLLAALLSSKLEKRIYINQLHNYDLSTKWNIS
jgi:hypothetical protein